MTPSPWEYFSVEELSCRCGCGRWDMNADFMDKMVKVRKFLGVSLPVTSGYRCPEWDAKVGTSHNPGGGPHTTGHAIDIGISGPFLFDYLDALRKIGGFTGVGLDQKPGKGPSGWFVHTDDLTAVEAGVPRPNLWTY